MSIGQNINAVVLFEGQNYMIQASIMLVTLRAIPCIAMEILIRSCRKCYTVKTDNCSVQALDNVGRLFHLAGKKVTHDCNQNPNISRLEMTRQLTGRRTNHRNK